MGVPNAIFSNANINAQRAIVTGSMIWHTNPRPRICRAGLRSPDACILLVIYDGKKVSVGSQKLERCNIFVHMQECI